MIYIDPQNWSYSEDEMLEYKDEKTIFFNSKKILNMNEKIPEKFRFNSKREAEYLFNENGFKNLKILIFRDFPPLVTLKISCNCTVKNFFAIGIIGLSIKNLLNGTNQIL